MSWRFEPCYIDYVSQLCPTGNRSSVTLLWVHMNKCFNEVLTPMMDTHVAIQIPLQILWRFSPFMLLQWGSFFVTLESETHVCSRGFQTRPQKHMFVSGSRAMLLPLEAKALFYSRGLKNCGCLWSKVIFLKLWTFLSCGYSIRLFHFWYRLLLFYSSLRSAIVREDDACAKQCHFWGEMFHVYCHRLGSRWGRFTTWSARQDGRRIGAGST